MRAALEDVMDAHKFISGGIESLGRFRRDVDGWQAELIDRALKGLRIAQDRAAMVIDDLKAGGGGGLGPAAVVPDLGQARSMTIAVLAELDSLINDLRGDQKGSATKIRNRLDIGRQYLDAALSDLDRKRERRALT